VVRARLWWSAALIAVPAVLAGIALLWAGPSAPAAPAAPPAARSTAPPAVPAPAVVQEPPSAKPDPQRAQLTEVLSAQPIRFGADSAELAGPPADTARHVAELIKAGPAAPVLVEGFVADTPGGPEKVLRLSEKRAAVVAEALVAAGVPADRITARGLGAQRALATVEESRRVEITIG
jgi:outer membrane protein OmpA-like peptidoglycan-associated protein